MRKLLLLPNGRERGRSNEKKKEWKLHIPSIQTCAVDAGKAGGEHGISQCEFKPREEATQDQPHFHVSKILANAVTRGIEEGTKACRARILGGEALGIEQR